MLDFKVVEKLGGQQKGHHFFVEVPRQGDYVILGDVHVWKVKAVALYGHSTGQTPQGSIGELVLTEEKPT